MSDLTAEFGRRKWADVKAEKAAADPTWEAGVEEAKRAIEDARRADDVHRIVARWERTLSRCGLELHQLDVTGACVLGTGKVDLKLLAEDALAALNDGYPESVDLGPDDQVFICGEQIDGCLCEPKPIEGQPHSPACRFQRGTQYDGLGGASS